MNQLEIIKREIESIKKEEKELNKRYIDEEEDEDGIHKDYLKFQFECAKKINELLKERTSWATKKNYHEYCFCPSDFYLDLLKSNLNFKEFLEGLKVTTKPSQ